MARTEEVTALNLQLGDGNKSGATEESPRDENLSPGPQSAAP
jgi:hypothetical protein